MWQHSHVMEFRRPRANDLHPGGDCDINLPWDELLPCSKLRFLAIQSHMPQLQFHVLCNCFSWTSTLLLLFANFFTLLCYWISVFVVAFAVMAMAIGAAVVNTATQASLQLNMATGSHASAACPSLSSRTSVAFSGIAHFFLFSFFSFSLVYCRCELCRNWKCGFRFPVRFWGLRGV